MWPHGLRRPKWRLLSAVHRGQSPAVAEAHDTQVGRQRCRGALPTQSGVSAPSEGQGAQALRVCDGKRQERGKAVSGCGAGPRIPTPKRDPQKRNEKVLFQKPCLEAEKTGRRLRTDTQAACLMGLVPRTQKVLPKLKAEETAQPGSGRQGWKRPPARGRSWTDKRGK